MSVVCAISGLSLSFPAIDAIVNAMAAASLAAGDGKNRDEDENSEPPRLQPSERRSSWLNALSMPAGTCRFDIISASKAIERRVVGRG